MHIFGVLQFILRFFSSILLVLVHDYEALRPSEIAIFVAFIFVELWVLLKTRHDEGAERKRKCLEGAPLTALTVRSNFCSVSLSYRIIALHFTALLSLLSGAHFFRMNGRTLLMLHLHSSAFIMISRETSFWCSHQKNVHDNHWTKRNFLSHSTMKN